MIPSFKNLVDLAHLLKENSNHIDYSDMEIIFYGSHSTINTLNEDVFYRNKMPGKPQTDVSEITINIEGITFKIHERP